jgi:dimeric dUTPase (all-alpha-NTP-PPase superfamily)
MNDLVLDDLYVEQMGLDETIALKHHLTYEQTKTKRLLALLVELGEFANETRCFKFWSFKPASNKEVILDEYADGMHFFLSLGLILNIKKLTHHFKKPSGDLTDNILKVYQLVSDLSLHYDEVHYLLAFNAFLDLLPLLDYSGEDAIKAYKAKLAVNYTRQENKY